MENLKVLTNALALVAAVTLTACSDSSSSGLLTDNSVCKPGNPAEKSALMDTANTGRETAVTATGTLGYNSSISQSFATQSETPVTGVNLKLAAPNGLAADLTVSLRTTSTGASSEYGTEIVSKDIAAAQVGAAGTWINIDFGDIQILDTDKTYYLHLTPHYASGDPRHVTWLSVPGSGMSTYETNVLTGLATWTARGSSAVYFWNECD